ncbi:unnamed protein product [Phaedon cochleariae]|uniref:E3 ubiquitin-protein ligase n=1 Tax=Phaedon cochleariae TaxID=80249 RepID=A0A9P0DFQ9_PHACE|nr:unnamed protein product [Phaedon cochleariae]
MFKIKCKKCRNLLFNEDDSKRLLLNAHNLPVTTVPDICETVNDENTLYLNEEHLPSWITLRIEAEKWSKGRINCLHCDSRIGAFDFISGQKCSCRSNILPPVHIIKSKVDLIRLNLLT